MAFVSDTCPAIALLALAAAACSYPTVPELRDREILYATPARDAKSQQAINCVLTALENERSFWSSLGALNYRVLQVAPDQWEILAAGGSPQMNRFTVTALEREGAVELSLRMAPPVSAQEGAVKRAMDACAPTSPTR